MEAGAIVGIVLGSVIIFLVIAYFIYKYAWKPNRNKPTRMPVDHEDAIMLRMKKNGPYGDPVREAAMRQGDEDPQDPSAIPDYNRTGTSYNRTGTSYNGTGTSYNGTGTSYNGTGTSYNGTGTSYNDHTYGSMPAFVQPDTASGEDDEMMPDYVNNDADAYLQEMQTGASEGSMV